MNKNKHHNVDGSKSTTPRTRVTSKEEHELRLNLLWGTKEEKLEALEGLYRKGIIDKDYYLETNNKITKGT